MKVWVVSATDQSQSSYNWLFATHDLAKKFFENKYKKLRSSGIFSGELRYEYKDEDSFNLEYSDYYFSCDICEKKVIENEEELYR